MVSQLFNGIVPRGGQFARVAGTVDKFSDGSWQGSFIYFCQSDTDVLNGTTTIQTDTKELWAVDITDDPMSLGGDCRSARFRVLEERAIKS